MVNLQSNKSISYGGVAQLGARLLRMQEVRGSIPLISTTVCLKTNVFRQIFRYRDKKRANLRLFFKE